MNLKSNVFRRRPSSVNQLSLREFELATLVARRVPYAKIAKQYCVSVGRLKNIVQEIYGKLFVSGRDELSKYIL